MSKLTVMDALSVPGSPDRSNEDSLGWTADCAFVIDGATGIGPDFITGPTQSDAAWLANFAKVHFEETVVPGRKIADIVRKVSELAGEIVTSAAAGAPTPAWNLPVAAFEMVRLEGDRLIAYGLGDSLLFIEDAAGRLAQHTAMPGSAAAERDKAATLLAVDRAFALGGPGADNDTAIADERKRRATYNSPESNIWTLGTCPEAADHVAVATLSGPPARGLLCTDGFAALVTDYDRYSAGQLIDAARRYGLAELAAELREIEQVEDPDGRRFPRMKRSDDASAVLFEVVT
ncbi:hypothetical protein [Oricola sp.]|uniref:hypothetical protein n=1 Tax=Oricola sp. TaxID=1979950 RepID=UPI003BA912D7